MPKRKTGYEEMLEDVIETLYAMMRERQPHRFPELFPGV